MSDTEIKKGRTKKNGQPDKRSTSSAANVSKARFKVKDDALNLHLDMNRFESLKRAVKIERLNRP